MSMLLDPKWQVTALAPLMRLFAGKGYATEQAANTALRALMLPGDVYKGNVSMYGADGRTNPEVINRSADLAGMMTLGSGAIPADPNSLRMGIRAYRGGDPNGNWYSSSKKVAEAYAKDRGIDTITERDLEFTNPMVVDAKGENWINIGASPRYEVVSPEGKFLGYAKGKEDLKKYPTGAKLGAQSGFDVDGKSTDDLYEIARAKGHDGLIVNNVADNPDGGQDVGLSDIYAIVKKYGVAALVSAGVLSQVQGEELKAQGYY